MLMGCEKTTEIDLPELEPLLSLDARIYLGDSLVVFPGISASLTGGELPQSREDFSVRLYEDEILIDTLEPRTYQNYSEPVYRYHSSVLPRPGTNYRLECSFKGFPMAVAQQRAPLPPVIINYFPDSVLNKISVSISDPAGESNYYLFEIFNKNAGPSRGLESIRSTDPDVELLYEDLDIFNGGFGGRKAVLADTEFDGMNRLVEIFYGTALSAFDTHILRVSSITRDYYLYEKSRSVQYMNEQQFFNEGTNIYSNVSEGYGAFVIANPMDLEFNP